MHRLAGRVLRLEREVQRREMYKQARLTRTDSAGMTRQDRTDLQAFLDNIRTEGADTALANLGPNEPHWWWNWQKERCRFGGNPVAWADAHTSRMLDPNRQQPANSPQRQDSEPPVEEGLTTPNPTPTPSRTLEQEKTNINAHLRSSALTCENWGATLLEEVAPYMLMTPPPILIHHHDHDTKQVPTEPTSSGFPVFFQQTDNPSDS